MQTSIDGFVGASEPDVPWQLWDWSDDWTWDTELKKEFNSSVGAAGMILLSRPMLAEGYLDHWERIALDHPDEPDFQFAQRIGSLNKVVATSRHIENRWMRTAVIRGDLTETVRKLKDTEERDILTFGGRGFVARLMDLGLIDELQLYVNPAALGAGESIYTESNRMIGMELLDARPYSCGIVVSKYAPTASWLAI